MWCHHRWLTGFQILQVNLEPGLACSFNMFSSIYFQQQFCYQAPFPQMSMMYQMPLGLWLIWHLQRCLVTIPAMASQRLHVGDFCIALLPDTSCESWYVQSPNLIIDATEGTNHSSTESFKRSMNGTIPCNSRVMVFSRCFQHVWPHTYESLFHNPSGWPCSCCKDGSNTKILK